MRINQEDFVNCDSVVRGIVASPSHPRRRVKVRARKHDRNCKADVAGNGVSWRHVLDMKCFSKVLLAKLRQLLNLVLCLNEVKIWETSKFETACKIGNCNHQWQIVLLYPALMDKNQFDDDFHLCLNPQIAKLLVEAQLLLRYLLVNPQASLPQSII